jgi:hypothetical protein
MDVWSHDRADHQNRLKRLESRKEQNTGYRWRFGKLWEISVFPLTKLIMDVPRIIPAEWNIPAGRMKMKIAHLVPWEY